MQTYEHPGFGGADSKAFGNGTAVRGLVCHGQKIGAQLLMYNESNSSTMRLRRVLREVEGSVKMLGVQAYRHAF